MKEFPKREHEGEEEPSPMPSPCHTPGNSVSQLTRLSVLSSKRDELRSEHDGEPKPSGEQHVEVFDGHFLHYGIIFLKNGGCEFLLLLL